MPNPSVLAGVHLKVYINGVLLGYITQMQWNVMHPHRPARGLDSNVVKEWIPSTFDVGGTFGVLRGRDTGGLEGAGMTAFAHDLLLQSYFTLEIVDRLTDHVVFRADQCVVENQTWGGQPKGLVMGTFSWRGAAFLNEAYS